MVGTTIMSYSSTDTPDGRAGTAEPTETERHRLLASERRRAVLDVLTTLATPVDLEVLVESVTAYEARAEAPTDERTGRVAISLHHQHLPMMSEVGVLEYDPSTNRVESTALPDDVHSP